MPKEGSPNEPWSPLPEQGAHQTSEAAPQSPNILAVDLGLRCGIALVTPAGEVLMYRSKHFPNRGSLKRGIPIMLKAAGPLKLLVLEGGETLAKHWINAAGSLTPLPEIMRVAAERWRLDMLLNRQQKTGHDAKKAAQAIARQLIASSPAPNPTSLRHDAAEAVCLGVWAAAHLGGSAS